MVQHFTQITKSSTCGAAWNTRYDIALHTTATCRCVWNTNNIQSSILHHSHCLPHMTVSETQTRYRIAFYTILTVFHIWRSLEHKQGTEQHFIPFSLSSTYDGLWNTNKVQNSILHHSHCLPHMKVSGTQTRYSEAFYTTPTVLLTWSCLKPKQGLNSSHEAV